MRSHSELSNVRGHRADGMTDATTSAASEGWAARLDSTTYPPAAQAACPLRESRALHHSAAIGRRSNGHGARVLSGHRRQTAILFRSIERVLQHKKAHPQILATSTLTRLVHDQGTHETPRTRRCGQSPLCCLTFALSGAPAQTQTEDAPLFGASALERVVRLHTHSDRCIH